MAEALAGAVVDLMAALQESMQKAKAYLQKGRARDRPRHAEGEDRGHEDGREDEGEEGHWQGGTRKEVAHAQRPVDLVFRPLGLRRGFRVVVGVLVDPPRGA
ncbi:hypothetical protein ACIHCV_31910 [Streptomyces sp. NPDC051956]|uniref:hypothetical protein n=1 Tax=Streptomyces sp. NPDC051956 TaxID=3365677 RepID=UPI0037CE7B0C